MVDLAGEGKVCVVVGAGHAGSSLAVQLRKEGWAGRIVLIGDEEHVPYHRPPLSKAVLAGEKSLDTILLRPLSHYETSGIELRLGVRVESIDRESQILQLASGESLHYDALALCTGTSPRRLPGRILGGVYYLRTADDAAHIRAAALAARRAVIIGGGYIGLEVAAVLVRQGLNVTVLEAANRLLKRVASPVISDYFNALHTHNGVRVETSVSGLELEGAGQVSGVRDGSGTLYPADIVIVGIGVLPQTQLAQAAGLEVNNGIVVDGNARTSDPRIFAAGDCTLHPSARYGKCLRLESVQNALDQARVAAASICSKDVLYDALPWFWSDQYDIKLQSVGLLLDHEQHLVRGDVGNANGKGFSVFYLRGGHMIAADCINRSKEFIACKRLISERIPLNVEALCDESCSVDDFVKLDE